MWNLLMTARVKPSLSSCSQTTWYDKWIIYKWCGKADAKIKWSLILLKCESPVWTLQIWHALHSGCTAFLFSYLKSIRSLDKLSRATIQQGKKFLPNFPVLIEQLENRNPVAHIKKNLPFFCQYMNLLKHFMVPTGPYCSIQPRITLLTKKKMQTTLKTCDTICLWRRNIHTEE